MATKDSNFKREKVLKLCKKTEYIFDRKVQIGNSKLKQLQRFWFLGSVLAEGGKTKIRNLFKMT